MGMLKDVSEYYEMSEVTPVVGVTSDSKFYPIFKILFSYFIYYIMDTHGKV